MPGSGLVWGNKLLALVTRGRWKKINKCTTQIIEGSNRYYRGMKWVWGCQAGAAPPPQAGVGPSLSREVPLPSGTRRASEEDQLGIFEEPRDHETGAE